MAKTTIQISAETKEALTEIGKMGETYDDVINRLLVAYKVSKKPT